jgi:hypothetical protein
LLEVVIVEDIDKRSKSGIEFGIVGSQCFGKPGANLSDSVSFGDFSRTISGNEDIGVDESGSVRF